MSDSSDDEATFFTSTKPLPPDQPQTAYNALYNYEKYSGVKGMFCAHKHCHGHVPLGKHGNQAAKKANLCVPCYNRVKDARRFRKFPYCAVARVQDELCCYKCRVVCRCNQHWGRARDGTLSGRCTNADGVTSDCDDTPPLPDRNEPLGRIAEYESKLAELTKAEREEAAEWERMKAEWRAAHNK